MTAQGATTVTPAALTIVRQPVGRHDQDNADQDSAHKDSAHKDDAHKDEFDVHLFKKVVLFLGDGRHLMHSQTLSLGMDSWSISLPFTGQEQTWRVDVPMRSFQSDHQWQQRTEFGRLRIHPNFKKAGYRRDTYMRGGAGSHIGILVIIQFSPSYKSQGYNSALDFSSKKSSGHFILVRTYNPHGICTFFRHLRWSSESNLDPVSNSVPVSFVAALCPLPSMPALSLTVCSPPFLPSATTVGSREYNMPKMTFANVQKAQTWQPDRRPVRELNEIEAVSKLDCHVEIIKAQPLDTVGEGSRAGGAMSENGALIWRDIRGMSFGTGKNIKLFQIRHGTQIIQSLHVEGREVCDGGLVGRFASEAKASEDSESCYQIGTARMVVEGPHPGISTEGY
ncbi:hypothetical protein BDZ89DRAFT_1047134 [Hymenopellis radicata]|nr:hypothetical protein BDZ89DRAFT_1047134 [Hymenopellis radicata]